MSFSDDERIVIGEIIKPQGLKGECKVYPLTDNVKRYDELIEVFIDDKCYKIQQVKYLNKFVVLKFFGIDDINAAEQLRKKKIEIPIALAKKKAGEYFFFELLDMTVVDKNGCHIGKVLEVLDFPANPALEVEYAVNKQAYIPMVKDVILDINLENKIIIIDPLPGLLD